MESLMEILRLSVQPVTLPLTILLVLSIFYWLLVCFGFVNLDDGDSIFDFNSHGNGLDAHGHTHADAHGHHGGPFHFIAKFLNIGEAPLMAILSVLVLFAWAFAVLSNHYLNPSGSLAFGLVLLIPTILVSALLTRLLTKPLRSLFKAMSQDYDRHEPIIGQVCLVTTGEANESFGQATVDIRGAPLLLQIRITNGDPLRRGDRALIISEDKEKNCFHVVKYQEPKVED